MAKLSEINCAMQWLTPWEQLRLRIDVWATLERSEIYRAAQAARRESRLALDLVQLEKNNRFVDIAARYGIMEPQDADHRRSA